MHQPILMHAQIDKRTKGRHITHRTFKHHAFAQITDVFHALCQTRHLEIRPWVAPGFFQFFEDVLHRNDAHAFIRKQLGTQALQHVAAPHQSLHRLPSFFQNALHH